MARHKSTEKRERQAQKKRLRNRSVKSEIRTLTRHVIEAIEKGTRRRPARRWPAPFPPSTRPAARVSSTRRRRAARSRASSEGKRRQGLNRRAHPFPAIPALSIRPVPSALFLPAPGSQGHARQEMFHHPLRVPGSPLHGDVAVQNRPEEPGRP